MGSSVTLEKSGLKRDGPVFFSPAPVKVAGDEKTFFDHRSVDAGSLALEIGCFRPFLPSCFPYFNYGPAFRPYSAPPCLWPIHLRPSVVKNNGVHGVDHRPSRWQKHKND